MLPTQLSESELLAYISIVDALKAKNDSTVKAPHPKYGYGTLSRNKLNKTTYNYTLVNGQWIKTPVNTADSNILTANERINLAALINKASLMSIKAVDLLWEYYPLCSVPSFPVKKQIENLMKNPENKKKLGFKTAEYLAQGLKTKKWWFLGCKFLTSLGINLIDIGTFLMILPTHTTTILPYIFAEGIIDEVADLDFSVSNVITDNLKSTFKDYFGDPDDVTDMTLTAYITNESLKSYFALEVIPTIKFDAEEGITLDVSSNIYELETGLEIKAWIAKVKSDYDKFKIEPVSTSYERYLSGNYYNSYLKGTNYNPPTEDELRLLALSPELFNSIKDLKKVTTLTNQINTMSSMVASNTTAIINKVVKI
jgi:hypothetical protein